jgi:hypothetical protein
MKVVFISRTYIQAPEGKPEVRLGPGSDMMQPGGNYRHTTSCDEASDIGTSRLPCSRSDSRSNGQAHLLQHGDVTRIAFETLQKEIAFHLGESAVALRVGPLEPFEGAVGAAAERVNLGNLEGAILLVFRDELARAASASFLRPSAW